MAPALLPAADTLMSWLVYPSSRPLPPLNSARYRSNPPPFWLTYPGTRLPNPVPETVWAVYRITSPRSRAMMALPAAPSPAAPIRNPSVVTVIELMIRLPGGFSPTPANENRVTSGREFGPPTSHGRVNPSVIWLLSMTTNDSPSALMYRPSGSTVTSLRGGKNVPVLRVSELIPQNW